METFNYWDLAEWRNYADAMEILKVLADAVPAHPSKAWTLNKLGIVYEICCPHCKTVFEWTGKFYAPRCPNCERWLQERGVKGDTRDA